VDRIQKKLKQFKNDPAAFMQAIIETLEADVRSKFQTKRRIEDSAKGLCVEVPFDEAMVRFLWKDERLLEIVEVVLEKDTNLIEKQRLIEEADIEEDEIDEDCVIAS
jgi:hypothetical protein